MKDKNCILCKYRNDEESCKKAIYSPNWHCPTLSNLYYGKLIYHFPCNLLHKVQRKVWDYKYDKYYRTFNKDHTENDDVKLIFAVRSWDDLTPCDKPNLETMNDFELIYNKKTNTYSIGIETIYCFKDRKAKENYLMFLFGRFYEFMKDNGYKTTTDPFYMCNGCEEYDSIEDAYAAFKCFVIGYCHFGYCQDNSNLS